MQTPQVNLMEPRAPRRRYRWLAIGLLGALAVWQGFFSSSETSANSTHVISPITLITRVGRIVTGIDPLFAADRDRTNVLLLGMGGIGHEGPFLTDTIMIVSFKHSTNEVAMISIPRDLVADIPGIGPRKINHANALAEAERRGSGGELARKTVEKAFGITVPHYIRIDFSGFERLIDDLGGITVHVERSFTDEQFPVGENEFEVVSFARGAQGMDGQTALRFARSRHGSNGEGSDFARARRQQHMLTALADKILSRDTLTSPTKIKSLAGALSRHVATNLDIADLLSLADRARNANLGAARHIVLDDRPDGPLVSTLNEEGSFVLLPADGTGENLQAIARDVFAAKPAVPAAANRTVHLELQNGTNLPGLAYETSLKLREKGFAVVSYGNADRRDYVRTVIYDYSGGTHRDKLKELAELLNAEVATTIPTWLPAAQNKSLAVDFLVILGQPAL